MEINDGRKLYLIDLIRTIFETDQKKLVDQVNANDSLNLFLDDASCNFLRVHASQEFCSFSNEVNFEV